MTPFFAHNAGMIELGLVEGIVLVIAARELWSVRRSLRRPPPPPPRHSAADAEPGTEPGSAGPADPVAAPGSADRGPARHPEG